LRRAPQTPYDDAALAENSQKSPGAAVDDKDPAALVRRLSQLAGQSPEAANAIQAALVDANLAPSSSADASPWPKEAEAQLRSVLQIEEQEMLEPARMVELLGLLLDFVIDWDRAVWSTWKQLAPNSRFKRPQPLQRSIRALLTGESSVPRTQTLRDVTILKQLISSLVSAMGVAGSTFASTYLKEISPQQIEEFVRGGEEKIPFIGDRFKTGCWNKYSQLAAAMEDKAPEVINAAIVEFVEPFLRGAATSTPAAAAPPAPAREREE
jgi:hypothetical protein